MHPKYQIGRAASAYVQDILKSYTRGKKKKKKSAGTGVSQGSIRKIFSFAYNYTDVEIS